MTYTFHPVALIPHYNHSDTIGNVINAILALGLKVLIVDDGSSPEHQAVLKTLENERVRVIYSDTNGGKGKAMKIGMNIAFEQGFSHALQVDADGQHNLSDALKMLEKSRDNPTACICGKPIYGDDAPKARLYGRKITNFWLAINTHSMDLADGMCGFRIYPLAQLIPILHTEYIGERMDFDSEILVHCHWRKIPLIWVETPVKYEIGGISHFRGWADNWLISKMHARLFFKMVWRTITGKMR